MKKDSIPGFISLLHWKWQNTQYKYTISNILWTVLTLNPEFDELLMLPQWSVAKSSQYKTINLFDQREFAEFLLIWYIHLMFIGYNNGVSGEDDFIAWFKNERFPTLNQTVFEFLMMEFLENL